MLPFDVTALPITGLGAVFAAAAVVVWIAGTRLTGYVEAISERTGLGAVFLGALLLGGITSLPELATTVTASVAGDADLAVSNLFGGVAMQVAILAVADVATRPGAISSEARNATVLLQGALLIVVLAIAMAGIIVGEPGGWPVGAWSAGTLVLTLLSFWLMRRYEGESAWRPVNPEGRLEERGGEARADAAAEPPERSHRRSMRALIGLSGAAALAILVAGVVLARTGEGLAEKTGLGSNFVGAAFLAASTSLPELSTTLAAARLGRYDMAFSNVFGANLLDVGLLAVADAAYAGPPVLDEMDDPALFAALLAIAVTALFLVGLVRHRVRSVGGVGADSIAVLVAYLGGLYVLFTLR